MQLNQACNEFLRGYFSTHERRKKTEDAYRSDLAQFRAFAGEELILSTLDGSIIERWAAHLRQEDYSPASIRRKIVVLKVFCSYWVRKGDLKESPFWRVKLSIGRIKQLPRTLTEREMRALLKRAWLDYSTTSDIQSSPENTSQITLKWKASSSHYRTLRDLALIDLLFATGIRVGEVSAIDIRDFFVREAAFRVQGKGGRDRLAFIVDEETVRIQQAHLEARASIKTESPALFINVSGQRLSTQGITNVIARLRRAARIRRHVTPHMLRHTVATLLLRNGLDIRVVQEFLGHASIATTQRYTHVTKEHMVRELRKRHPSLNLRARDMAERNRVFFKTVDEAEAAGYKRAGNCPAEEEGQTVAARPVASTAREAKSSPASTVASTPIVASAPTTGDVIGNKNSKKYHLQGCPGYSQVGEKNRVMFKSVAEAEAAGYVKAGNCKK